MQKPKYFDNRWIKHHANDILAYSGLAFCLIVFSIFPPLLRGVNILDPSGLAFRSIVFDAVMYSLLASGAVFIYALGAMDISVGAQMSLYSVLLIHLYNANGSQASSIFFGLLLITAISMISGAVNSIIAAVLEMKPIITSLILQFFIYGIASVLMLRWNPDSAAISFDVGTASRTHFAPLRNSWVQLMVLFLALLIFTYLFKYTKLGKYVRAIGANQVCASQLGIPVVRYRLLAYLVFGVAIVLASLLFVANTGSTTANGAKGYEMKIMISLIIGGMPLSGGMKSKISNAVVGGFTFALISRSFVFLGVPDKFTTLFIAVIYLVVVLMTVRTKDQALPR
jgi:ribose transport system permease protein